MVANSEFGFLEPTESGESAISCTLVLQLSDGELRKRGAKKKGQITAQLLNQLLEFIENSPVLSEEDKELLLDGLGDWV